MNDICYPQWLFISNEIVFIPKLAVGCAGENCTKICVNYTIISLASAKNFR